MGDPAADMGPRGKWQSQNRRQGKFSQFFALFTAALHIELLLCLSQLFRNGV